MIAHDGASLRRRNLFRFSARTSVYFRSRKQIILGNIAATSQRGPVPMTASRQHLRARAGTSITKAVVLCRAQMHAVAQVWNKFQPVSGFQA